MAQPVLGGEGVEVAVSIAKQPAAPHPEPEASLGVFEDGLEEAPRLGDVRAVIDDPALDDLQQPSVTRTGPERALPIHVQRGQKDIGQYVFGHRNKDLVLKAKQAHLRSHQQDAVRVSIDDTDLIAGEPLFGVIVCEDASMVSIQAALIGAHPQRAVGVDVQIHDIITGEAVVGGEGAEVSVGVGDHAPAARPDPERAVGGFDQVLHAVDLESVYVFTVENGEGGAVEPDQALLRAEPEISIAGLHHRPYRTLGQPVGCSPRRVSVLGKGLRGIERQPGRRLPSALPDRQHYADYQNDDQPSQTP